MVDPKANPARQSPGRFVNVALVGAALLVVAGAGAFYAASQHAATAKGKAGDAVTVTLRDGICDPNALTVPAGLTQFRIVNQTDRVVEWEILDGVMVVEERENIAPGLTQTFAAKLKPGQYAITCGLLSNPRGVLTVTPSAGAETARPDLVAYIGPLAEYRVYLAMQANEFVKAAAALQAAIAAGDLAKARELYSAARAPYLRMDPVVSRFGDLDNSIDPVATYLAEKEADPAFTGLHRIEYGLFAKNDLTGLAPVAEKLVGDAEALKERLRATRLGPDDMASGASRSLTALAETRIPNGENLYAKSDLADFAAEVAGIGKIATLLKPVAAQTAPEPMADVESRVGALGSAVEALRETNGAPGTDAVNAAARQDLATKAREAAQAMDRLNKAIGIDTAGGA